MSWTAGVYTRLFGATGWADDKNAAINILASRHDSHDEDMATALNNCLLRDGTGVPTADTPWASKKITGLGAATAQTDAAQSAAGFIAEATLASSGTTDLGTAASHLISVTGTTAITSFGSAASTAAPVYIVKFSGALTLTYNATSLITPTGVNILTDAEDWVILKYLGSGNWRVLQFGAGTQNGSFTGTLTGCTTSPTASFTWSKRSGFIAIRCNGGLSATSNSTAMTVTGVPTPPSLVSVGTFTSALAVGIDNSVFVTCFARLQNGVLTFFPGNTSGLWTNSGTKGIGNSDFIIPTQW